VNDEVTAAVMAIFHLYAETCQLCGLKIRNGEEWCSEYGTLRPMHELCVIVAGGNPSEMPE
jgi:hypothetical protein